MDLLQKITLVWQKVNLVQRALLAAVLVAAVMIGFLVVHWARRPDMRMLYQELSPSEASQITEKIGEQDIPYQLRNGGTTIYVPRKHVYQLRLDLAKDGLPVGEQNGYKLFDDEKIGVSPFVQNVNLKRALQDELAKSIRMIAGVAHVRVHIVTPEQNLFALDLVERERIVASEQGQTSASVVLQLKPGHRLSASNIAAITHMVSGSVKDLKSEHVTVVDSQGQLLSGEGDSTLATGAGTVHDYKVRVEQGLVKKAEDMLTAVLGPGRATVRVSAVVDMNSVSTITETYDPTAKVATKEEITNNSETPSGNSGKTPTTGTKKDETILTEYQVGKTVKQQVVLPGEIRSLSVAAFVDLSIPDANATEPAGQPALIMPVTEVEEIIRTALGLKESDSLKVVHARFHQPAATLIEEEAPAWPRYLALARHLSLGIMALCALMVFRIFSRARSKAVAAVQAQQLPEGGGMAGGLLPAGSPSGEPVLLKRQITHALRNNPEQVREMFLSWIEEKE